MGSLFRVKPNPGVLFSETDEAHLPILSFHLVLVVEPDPETYMPLPGDLKKCRSVLQRLAKAFNAALDIDREMEYAIPLAGDVDYPALIWFRYEDDDFSYFRGFFDLVAPDVTFTPASYDELDHLRFCLQGVARQHPTWRACVVGAMLEDDVIRIANLVQECGLSTTVIQRYCLSNQGFVNLDELAQYKSWLETGGEEKGEPG